MKELNRKMAKGALWMGLLRVSVRGLGLISTIILARLLVPADFGIVAMATSITAFLQLATAFSFDIPLIQKQDADRDYFDSAWTMNVLFYATLTLPLVLLAGPAAAFYQDPRLVDVVYVLAIGFFIQGFENIGIVYFRKELNFRQDFILMFVRKLAGFLVTIPLALLLRNYWAMIVGMVTSSLVGVALSYWLHPFRPRFSLGAARELFTFSKWLMLNNIINFLRTRSPDFVIGRISGTSSLGLFRVAFEISTLPTTELVAPVNRAVFPGYSKLASDRRGLQTGYLDVLAVVALVALPAGFGIAAVAQPLIDLALGDKWADAASIVSILAIYGGVNAIQTNTGSVFNALGKPYLITLVGLITMAILLTSSITLALKYGPVGVAVSYLGTTSVMGPFTYFLICRVTGLSGRELTSAILPPLSASLLMYTLVTISRETLLSTFPAGNALQLLVLVPLGVISYVAMIGIIWLLRGRPHHSAEYRLAILLYRRLRKNEVSSVK